VPASINICFSTANGFFSKVIRWFTRSRASHSLITFYDITLDRVFVMEANGRGFMLVPWSKWRKSNTMVARYSLSIGEAAQIESLRALSGSLGAEYDYVSLLGFIFRRFKKRMANPLNNPTKLICSEAVANFLAGAGLVGFGSPGTWVPEDLMDEARSREEFILEEGDDGGVPAS
jgi:hypothetical protein